MYLTQCLHRMARHAPDSVAIIDGDGQASWRELAGRAARFAGAMQALGVKAGDRIALLARNGALWPEYLFGAWWAGAVVNPVNLRWSADEVAWSLADCDTRLLIVAPEFEPLVEEIRARVPRLRIISTEEPAGPGVMARREWAAGSAAVADELRHGDDLAAILYTGGTTGRPKGVTLSHANLACSAIGNLAQPGCGPGANVLQSAPLFHVGGLSSLLIAMLGGSRCTFVPGFEPLAVLRAIVAHQVNDLFLVPTMLRMLLDHPTFGEFDLASVETIRYGAAPIEDKLLDRAMAAFPGAGFVQAYGMTELAPVCCVLGPEDHTPEARAQGRGRSAGRATAVCEVRVVDPDDRELPRGEIGEIVVRGPTVMRGYWNRPDETAAALRGGWMHSGDLGSMDEAGYVTIVDRLKDMIITGGENVYSVEVENMLATCPEVGAAAVVGIPDPLWGERVHAVIVLRDGCSGDPDAIRQRCRATLAGYKVPRSIEFVDALPLSGAGKVLKAELRLAARLGEERAPTADRD